MLGDLGWVTTAISIGKGVYEVLDSNAQRQKVEFQAGAAEREAARTIAAAGAAQTAAEKERAAKTAQAQDLLKKWGPIVAIGLGAMILGLFTRKRKTEAQKGERHARTSDHAG